MNKHLLLVEDDPLISRTLKLSLSYRGYEVEVCETASDGRKKFLEKTFDIVILDVNLPDESGYTLCKSLRQKTNGVPIIMLTARADENSAVLGIDAGADDYVRKPFGLEELTARLNRLVNRSSKKEDFVSFHSIRLSPKQRLVWVDENLVSLGKREFDILALLMNRNGEVVTREEILTALDTDLDIYDRTIDSHLSHLRKKLKDADLKGVQITPVYGVGYRLEKK
jgi:DNA-binding response OmpR family regulator